MDINKAQQILDIPFEEWKGNCSWIAQEFLDKGIVSGEHQYGQYHGKISSDGYFGGRNFCQHAWILRDDGKIVDPTRWVFENVEPYIYITDEDDSDYDYGANRLKESLTFKPAPPYSPDENQYSLTNLDDAVRNSICNYLSYSGDNISLGQIFWLSNMPLHLFDEDCVEEIYKFIIDQGHEAFIPVDNRKKVLK